MENITHTLTGILMARAGLRRLTPRASLLLAMAANVPDIDIVALSGGWFTYFEYHRGITHSLLAAPVMAILPVLVIRLVERKPIPWLGAFVVSLLGVLSHLALDWTNAYGIRLFLPFSPAWPSGDLNALRDLWIWAILGLGLVAPAISRLVSSEIGAKKSTGFGWAVFALAGVLAYDGLRYVVHQRALAVVNSRLYDGVIPGRVGAFPGQNPFRWTGLVETPREYRYLTVSLTDEFDPSAGRTIYKADPSPAIDAARASRAFQVFLGFSSFPVWQVLPLGEPAGAVRVSLFDLRFGLPGQTRFYVSAAVGEDRQPRDVTFGFGGRVTK